VLSFETMSLSRRQFFRRLTRPGERTAQERQNRYEAMDAYVRTHLLPYDFSLTEEQEAELFAFVRSDLENTGDEELFSAIVRFRVEEVTDRKIRFWREENLLKDQLQRVQEIRNSAPDYVGMFLNAQATPAAVDQLKSRFGIDCSKELELELTARIQEWVKSVDDAELLQYNVVTVKDLVFAQLRSWC
jgi:hypothetical protein